MSSIDATGAAAVNNLRPTLAIRRLFDAICWQPVKCLKAIEGTRDHYCCYDDKFRGRGMPIHGIHPACDARRLSKAATSYILSEE